MCFFFDVKEQTCHRQFVIVYTHTMNMYIKKHIQIRCAIWQSTSTFFFSCTYYDYVGVVGWDVMCCCVVCVVCMFVDVGVVIVYGVAYVVWL